jgi:predicted restriction endonuclease
MLPTAQPRQRPAIFDKRDQAREKLSRQRSIYAAVNERDQRQCRCCGRKAARGESLHHHHIVFRSKRGADSTENLLLLCVWCHSLIHARQLWILGKNADKRLSFEIDERAVVDVFGSRELPRDVRILKAKT